MKEELRLNSSGQSREMPPYIRRTKDNRLLVTVAEPVERDHHTVGIILLTREAREVDDQPVRRCACRSWRCSAWRWR